MPEDETTTTPETPEAPAAGKTPTLEDLLADLDEDRRTAVLGQVSKARSEAKNLRERLKAAEPKAAQYDQAQAAQQTAEQRAQQQAQEAEQRATAANRRVARAEIKAALAGVVDDPDEIVDDLDLSRFLDGDGDVDATAVTALRDKYAARFSGQRRAPRPDTSQASGANGPTTTDPAQTFASILSGQLRQT